MISELEESKRLADDAQKTEIRLLEAELSQERKLKGLHFPKSEFSPLYGLDIIFLARHLKRPSRLQAMSSCKSWPTAVVIAK